MHNSEALSRSLVEANAIGRSIITAVLSLSSWMQKSGSIGDSAEYLRKDSVRLPAV
jgi:hypothetical protein